MSGPLTGRGGPGLGWSVWATGRAPPVSVRGPPAASRWGGGAGSARRRRQASRPPSCCVIMTRAGATRGPGWHTPFMDGPEAVYPAPNDYSASPWVIDSHRAG